MPRKEKRILKISTAWYEKKDQIPVHLKTPKTPFLQKATNQLLKPKAIVVDIVHPIGTTDKSNDSEDEDFDEIFDNFPSITLSLVALNDGECIKFFFLDWDESKKLYSILNEIFGNKNG